MRVISEQRKRTLSLIVTAALMICGCGRGIASIPEDAAAAPSSESDETDAAVTIGFSQVGEESDWRRANSDNIKSTFTADHGYHLLFDDAQNKPENQTTAIRNFVQQGVDYIVLEPIIETGWDTVLTEAKEAGIPVIVADRKILVSDESLYTAWVGSEWVSEGAKACEWLHLFAAATAFPESEIRIVNIQGTIGSTPQIERDKMLQEYAEQYGWKMLGSKGGDFVQAKGREAMEALLTEHPDLNVVYCDNDNEAFGAIDALEAAGRRVGSDLQNGEIMVISFDATKKGLELVLEGKIACDAECNPLHGPRIEKIIQALEAGTPIDKNHYVEESIFAGNELVPEVTVNGKSTRVSVVTEELLQHRVY